MGLIAWMRIALELINVALTVVLFLLIRASERRHVTGERFKALEGRVAEFDGALARVATRAEIGKIHARIDDISSGMNRVAGQLDEIGKTTRLMQHALLRGDG